MWLRCFRDINDLVRYISICVSIHYQMGWIGWNSFYCFFYGRVMLGKELNDDNCRIVLSES